MYRIRKRGEATKEENRGIAWVCSNGIKRTKACLEITGEGHVGGSRKDFANMSKTKADDGKCGTTAEIQLVLDKAEELIAFMAWLLVNPLFLDTLEWCSQTPHSYMLIAKLAI